MTQHLRVRGLVANRLDRMLDDTSLLPQPADAGPVEEPPAETRVCDEAYLLLRRLLDLNESEEQHVLNSDAFLSLSFEDRDMEIQKARGSRTWTDFTGEPADNLAE